MTDTWFVDIFLGVAIASPFGLLGTITMRNFMCMVPLSNSMIGFTTNFLLFLFFLNHSETMHEEDPLLRFSQQEVLKYTTLVRLNLASMSAELPYLMSTCFVFNEVS